MLLAAGGLLPDLRWLLSSDCWFLAAAAAAVAAAAAPAPAPAAVAAAAAEIGGRCKLFILAEVPENVSATAARRRKWRRDFHPTDSMQHSRAAQFIAVTESSPHPQQNPMCSVVSMRSVW